jgi:hypothetical protein
VTAFETQLSCYTTALLAYLRRSDPRAAERVAAAVRLAVRTDLRGGVAFSQHERLDLPDGRLRYAGAENAGAAINGVRSELRASGAVLVVGNTAALPWSPACGRVATPHWFLVTGENRAGFTVCDPFAALLPLGEQLPFTGRPTAAQLAEWCRLPEALPPHVARRDVLALGSAVPVGAGPWRWLRRRSADDTPRGDVDAHPDEAAPGPGRWIRATAPALHWLAGRLSTDPAALAAGVDDLWAAARHQVARAAWLRDTGRVPTGHADDVITAWGELPRTLRFAVDSAARGRPRAGMVQTGLNRLGDLTDRLEQGAHAPPTLPVPPAVARPPQPTPTLGRTHV